MKVFVFTALLLFMVHIVRGQDETGNITPREAKDLLRASSPKNADTVKIDQLLRLALYNILKPGSYKPDLDSAATFISSAESIAGPVKSPATAGYIAWVKSNLCREKGEKEKGKVFAQNAIDLLKKTNDKYHLGLAYLEMAHYYGYGDFKQASEKINLNEQAVNALKQSDHIETKAYAYKSLADLYQTKSEYSKGFQNIELSLQAYQSIHYEQLQGVYIIYSGLYSLTGDYRNALKYGLDALKTAESVKDTTMQLCEINNMVAVLLGKLDEKEKAIGYYKNALQIAERYNDNGSEVLIISNIGTTYKSMGKYNEALKFLKSVNPKYLEAENAANSTLIPGLYCKLYIALKLYPQAKPYVDKLLKILSLRANDVADLSNVYDVLIQYYTATKQYSLARAYLIKNDGIIKTQDANMPEVVLRNYGRWSKLDSAMGNYQAALYYHVRYTTIKDSLFTITKSRQLKQLEVEYETEKKTTEIKILNQKNELLNKSNEIEQINLEKANLIRDFTLAGVSSLIIILALLYRQYRVKQKSNESITHKNDLLQHLLTEKEWLLKEVHHRVKNNLHTVICLLESQAQYLENDALKAIENSQHRIYAMSLIHQKLYQSDDIKTIDMAEYIPELVKSLEDGFGTSDQIKFNLKIDPVNLDISHAIPLGLIINEAITNSIKYAFPDNRKGEISISMLSEGERIKLELADDGIGMPQIDKETERESLGLRLMKGLSEDIDADISFKVDNGTRINIVFDVDPLNNGNILSAGAINKGVYV